MKLRMAELPVCCGDPVLLKGTSWVRCTAKTQTNTKSEVFGAFRT